MQDDNNKGLEPVEFPSSADTSSTPPPPKSFLKKFFKILAFVAIAASVIAMAVVIYYIAAIFIGLNQLSNDCAKTRTHLFSQSQEIVDDFKSTEFVSGQTNIKTEIDNKQEGDCIDSLPMLYIITDFDINKSAGIAFDEIVKTLSARGYHQEEDDFPELNPCLAYPVNDQKVPTQKTFLKGDDEKINVFLTCEKDDIRGVDVWRQIPATHVRLDLEISKSP